MLVSLIICTYNRKEDLRVLLDSAKRLTYSPLEIIVVDNNSTDGTEELVARYAVRYVRETRQGVSYARSRGIDESRGEYIAFVDDDEIITSPDLIEQLRQGFELDERIGAVGGLIVPKCTDAAENSLTEMFLKFNGQDLGKTQILSDDKLLISGNIMYKKEAIGAQRFNPVLGRKGKLLLGREEIDFNKRLKAKGYKFAYVHGASVEHILPGKRFTVAALANLHFCEGLSEYLENEKVLFRRLHKPVVGLLSLALSLLTFRRETIINRYLRWCMSLGTCYGPIYQLTRR